ncbi:hypothetical protein Pelo_19601 [Pelomyxa schiedti]|nr:hypothetical protein Pelo_19601 [Pelomyxa schiedti]
MVSDVEIRVWRVVGATPLKFKSQFMMEPLDSMLVTSQFNSLIPMHLTLLVIEKFVPTDVAISGGEMEAIVGVREYSHSAMLSPT